MREGLELGEQGSFLESPGIGACELHFNFRVIKSCSLL